MDIHYKLLSLNDAICLLDCQSISTYHLKFSITISQISPTIRGGPFMSKSVTQSKPATKKKARPIQLPEVPSELSEIVNLIGPKIAALRKAQALSLQRLANNSDVSAAAIHKIEHNGMVPTITTLLKLAGALGVPVSYFVSEDALYSEPVHHTRVGSRREVYTPHKGLNLASISGSYRQFQAAAAVARMTIKAHSGEKLLKHPGEELVYILSGEVIFTVGEQEYPLFEGDSLHFSGDLPHRWENLGKKEAELIWLALRSG